MDFEQDQINCLKSLGGQNKGKKQFEIVKVIKKIHNISKYFERLQKISKDFRIFKRL